MALGRTKHAIPDLTDVLQLRPDFKQAQDQRGNIYIKQGRYELAEVDFKGDEAKRNEIQVCSHLFLFTFYNGFYRLFEVMKSPIMLLCTKKIHCKKLLSI